MVDRGLEEGSFKEHTKWFHSLDHPNKMDLTWKCQKKLINRFDQNVTPIIKINEKRHTKKAFGFVGALST